MTEIPEGLLVIPPLDAKRQKSSHINFLGKVHQRVTIKSKLNKQKKRSRTHGSNLQKLSPFNTKKKEEKKYCLLTSLCDDTCVTQFLQGAINGPRKGNRWKEKRKNTRNPSGCTVNTQEEGVADQQFWEL